MLKIVLFLVLGVIAIGIGIAIVLGLLVLSLQLLGYVLVLLFKFFAWVFAKLVQGIAWVKARCQAQTTVEVTRAPEDAPELSPVLDAPETAQAEGVEPIHSEEPVPAVGCAEAPAESAQPEPETEEKPIEPLVVTSTESALSGEPELKIETAATEDPMPEDALAELPPAEVIVSPLVIASPEPAPPIVPPKPASLVAKPTPPQAPVPRPPVIPPRPPSILPPARLTIPQLPDFVGVGRRRFRLMVEKDPNGRPGMVIVCQLQGVFKEGWRGPIRITVTTQEFSDGKHHPLIRLGNPDFNPANPDVIRDFPDGARFGFRDWTTIGRINLNEFEGHGSGSSQLEVTCRGWEIRDKGELGDLIFEETEAQRAVLVTGGYFARKQRQVEQLKAVVVVLRLFVCLDGGERNVTNRLNKHFEAVGARFMRRWVGGDNALRDIINSEFIRRLQGSRLPADTAVSASLSRAPKDLRDWLINECAEISEEFKPQATEGEAVKQLAALSKLLGGP